MEIKGGKRVRDILKELSLLPESHLVVKGGELVTEDELIKDDEEITIISAISGGL